MNEYDISATVTMRCNFKVDTALTDPTTISLTVTDSAGTATTYTYAGATVTKDAVGQYSKGLVVTLAGEWIYTFAGTGAVAASGTKRFAVRRSGA